MSADGHRAERVKEMPMDEKLRLLMLEDVSSDDGLVERELTRAGIRFYAKRVDSKEEFESQLTLFKPDLILSDYSLPGFDGLSALSLARRTVPKIPFIFVSGHI